MEKRSPVQAIKEKCRLCQDGHVRKVSMCEQTECPLYPFRTGKNPNIHKRPLSAEQKAEIAARLKRGRSA